MSWKSLLAPNTRDYINERDESFHHHKCGVIPLLRTFFTNHLNELQ